MVACGVSLLLCARALDSPACRVCSVLRWAQVPYVMDLHLFLGRRMLNRPEPGTTFDPNDPNQVGSIPTAGLLS